MFDLAIIGGGVIGATALFLARQEKPEWRTLLLDRSLIAKGASAFSAGLDFAYGRTPWQKQLSMTSEKMYSAFKEKIPALPIRRLAFIGVVTRENSESVLERFTAANIHRATDTERAAVLAQLPGCKIADDQEILVGASGGIGLVDQIVSLLVAKACGPGGGQCWEGAAVSQICSLPEGGNELALLDGRRIPARRVLIATGPWLLAGPGGEIARKAGVRTKKVAALHVLCAPSRESPVLYFFDEDAFLLPVVERGHWIFSFTSREWDCVPDAGVLHITPAERNSALAVLEKYYPDMLTHCSGGRVFCDAYSQDWAPVVVKGSDVQDVVVAGACSGAGFRIAPAIALNALRLFSGFTSSFEM